MPKDVTDRAADIWEPLLTIADAAGGNWPRRAREACVELIGAARKTEQPRMALRLLADLRGIFGDADRLSTEVILQRLRAPEESPWGPDKYGKPLDARGLACLLGEYQTATGEPIKPRQGRYGGVGCKGYRASDLQDAWTRYVPAEQEQEQSDAGPEPTQQGAAPNTASETRPASETKNPPLTCGVSGVSDVSPPGGRGEADQPEQPCRVCGTPMDPWLVEHGETSHPTCTPHTPPVDWGSGWNWGSDTWNRIA
jgi:hypothetical protein